MCTIYIHTLARLLIEKDSSFIRVKYSYEKIIAKQAYTDIRAINNTYKKTGKLNRTTGAEGSVWFSSRSTLPPAYPPNS